MVDNGMREGPMKDWEKVEAEAGAQEALLRLRGRYRLVVATNAEDSPAADVRLALARVGLDEYVDDVISSADVGDHKPNYAFFRAALLHEGVRGLPLDPRRAVMVGDGTTNDIAGAQRAGIRTIWYNPTKRRFPDGAQPPDAVIRKLTELPGGGGPPRRRHAGEAVPQAAQGRRRRRGGGGGRGGLQGPARRDGAPRTPRRRPRRPSRPDEQDEPAPDVAHRSAGRTTRREVAMDLSHPDQWCRRALQLGVDAATPVDADAVVAAEWVRMKCLFGCDEPGIRKTCPPNLPPVAVTQRLLSEYRHGVLLEVGPIVGEREQRPRVPAPQRRRPRARARPLPRRSPQGVDDGRRALRPVRRPAPRARSARRPEKARPSMEGCGIDVFATVRNAGRTIDVVRDEDDEYRYFALVLVD